ncbi:MAG: amphi-Trp domain-containing protein [Deltaproteobacteria bacterium]|jgi:amphi-Trp domain-containing protein|nr:amphi-Trp domain-containing protein [Deltaproteobacteria bacterium]
MKKTNFHYSFTTDPLDVARYLEALIAGFKNGDLTFCDQNRQTSLKPADIIDIRIDTSSRLGRVNLNLAFSWDDAGAAKQRTFDFNDPKAVKGKSAAKKASEPSLSPAAASDLWPSSEPIAWPKAEPEAEPEGWVTPPTVIGLSPDQVAAMASDLAILTDDLADDRALDQDAYLDAERAAERADAAALKTEDPLTPVDPPPPLAPAEESNLGSSDQKRPEPDLTANGVLVSEESPFGTDQNSLNAEEEPSSPARDDPDESEV